MAPKNGKKLGRVLTRRNEKCSQMVKAARWSLGPYGVVLLLWVKGGRRRESKQRSYENMLISESASRSTVIGQSGRLEYYLFLRSIGRTILRTGKAKFDLKKDLRGRA